MEFLSDYSSELMIGGSSTIGAFIVAVLKIFSKRLTRIEDNINELQRKIDINTALDKERAGK